MPYGFRVLAIINKLGTIAIITGREKGLNVTRYCAYKL
jgi:hypothetical protein